MNGVGNDETGVLVLGACMLAAPVLTLQARPTSLYAWMSLFV